MVQKIKRHKKVIFVLGLGFCLTMVVLVMSGIVALPDFASAQEEETISVTATVEPYLTFTAQPASVSLTPSLVNTSGNTNIGSSTNISLLVGTSGTGWIVQIEGLYGALASTGAATATIQSVPVAATTTIAAGTDGYGVNATPSIANVTIGGNGYNNWGTFDVGAISSTTPQTLMSKTTSNASTTVGLMKIYAAADAAQPAGTYTDTITLTATSQ